MGLIVRAVLWTLKLLGVSLSSAEEATQRANANGKQIEASKLCLCLAPQLLIHGQATLFLNFHSAQCHIQCDVWIATTSQLLQLNPSIISGHQATRNWT